MVIIIVLVHTGTVVLEADGFVRRLAIQRTDEVLAGCMQLDEPTIDLGRYPVALRALRGHPDDVRFTAGAAEIAGVRLADLRGQVRRVQFRVLGGTGDITIHDAGVTARLAERDLELLLDDLGVDGTVHIDEDAVEIQLDRIPITIRLDIGVEAGAAVRALDGALEPLLRLRFDAPGVTVRTIDPTFGALHIVATANGSPRQIACEAEAMLATRLQSGTRHKVM
jgi:hypothetical protein